MVEAFTAAKAIQIVKNQIKDNKKLVKICKFPQNANWWTELVLNVLSRIVPFLKLLFKRDTATTDNILAKKPSLLSWCRHTAMNIRNKQSSLFCLSVRERNQSFITLATGWFRRPIESYTSTWSPSSGTSSSPTSSTT